MHRQRTRYRYRVHRQESYLIGKRPTTVHPKKFISPFRLVDLARVPQDWLSELPLPPSYI